MLQYRGQTFGKGFRYAENGSGAGASGGIGAAIAARLAKEGFAVAALYHQNAAGAEALVQEITAAGGTAAAFACDIRNSKAVADTVDAVHEKLGRVDVLVGSAGIARQKLFQDITDAEWDEMRGVHLDGAFYLTRAVLPDMLHEKCGASSISPRCGAKRAARARWITPL